jgi:TolB-like protein
VKSKPDLEQKVRTNRILSIDRLIREGKYPTTNKLACKLEVTSRTIQRDIEYMRKNKSLVSFLFLLLLILCLSNVLWAGGKTDNSDRQPSNSITSSESANPTNQISSSDINQLSRRQVSLYKGDGGKGIIIAVPTPSMRGRGTQDAWIPQFFQDVITGDLARFSAMTVLDRTNENLVITEQQLSESGFYSDDDFLDFGNITNAQYIVAGNIQNTNGTYTVTFRINDVRTNEVKSSYAGRYRLADIESGKAAKETVRELLIGMGIELTTEGEQLLIDKQDVQVQATQQLARGMTSEKNGNIVEALAYLSEAAETNTTREEANRHILSFFGNISTLNIQERINYALIQEAKWKKIFEDLKIYVKQNLPIFIYDFSQIEDTIDTRSKKVTFKVSPGVKVIPNRTALVVYKTILDNWFRIRSLEENSEWAKNVHLPGGSLSFQPQNYDLAFQYSADINLYDDYGDRITSFRFYGHAPSLYIPYLKQRNVGLGPDSNFQIKAKHKYYEDGKFIPITCEVTFDNVTSTLTPLIEQVYIITGSPSRKEYIDFPILTISEWEQWLLLYEAAR